MTPGQAYASSSPRLEDYLEKYGKTYSQKHLRMLQEIVRATPDRLASFVGAGISKLLGTSDWKSLMETLLDYAGEDTIRKYKELIEKSADNNLDPMDCKWRSKSVPSGGRKVCHLGKKLVLRLRAVKAILWSFLYLFPFICFYLFT